MSEVEESGYVEDAAADWDIESPILSTAFKNITRDGMESAFSDFLSHGDVGWRLEFLESFPRRVMEQVHRCAATNPTGVTLQYMIRSIPGSLSARFLLQELPIRISRLAAELDSLPFGLSLQPAVLEVRDRYLDSFRDLRSFPAIKETTEEELEFTQMLGKIIIRHNSVGPLMALGVQQLKKSLDPTMVYDDWKEIQQTLDRFFTSRIGLRMLIEQHCASHDANRPRDYVGCINTKTSPAEVAELACRDARAICFQEYGCAPDLDIYGDPDFTFSYVPPHLHFMVFELVKNSLRAVQERFMNDEVAPPIRIIIAADGIEHVTIKVSDEGGGIRRGDLRKIFTYLYSTAKNPLDAQSDLDEASVATTMAGYGYGLPVSRLYARYFGGGLKIISMEGYGTDAYLHLPRLGDSTEPLP